MNRLAVLGIAAILAVGIGCTYWYVASRESNTNKQMFFREALSDCKNLLDAEDITFFLMSGTALGCHREGKFIQWDKDIDIGVFAEDYNETSVLDAMEPGFTLTGNSGYEGKSHLAFKHKLTNVVLDIFVLYKTDEGREYVLCNSKKCTKSFDSDFTLNKVKFMGMEVNIPHPIEEYLENNYGKDYMTPTSNYSCWTARNTSSV